jgi:hypothetical protein
MMSETTTKPIAFMRKLFFDKEKLAKVLNANRRWVWPKKFILHELSVYKILDDDIALFAESPDYQAEINQLKKDKEQLIGIISDLEQYIDRPPTRNCSCHIAPPCSDCVDYAHLREVLETADSITKTRAITK